MYRVDREKLEQATMKRVEYLSRLLEQGTINMDDLMFLLNSIPVLLCIIRRLNIDRTKT